MVSRGKKRIAELEAVIAEMMKDAAANTELRTTALDNWEALKEERDMWRAAADEAALNPEVVASIDAAFIRGREFERHQEAIIAAPLESVT